MTKMFALLASAALGTAALAQSTPMAPTDSPSSMPQPMPSTTDTSAAPSAAPGTDSTPQNQAMPSAPMPAPTDTTSNSSAAVPPMSNPSAAMPTTAQADYPMCSRTVTDKCTQHGAMHKTMRHKG